MFSWPSFNNDMMEVQNMTNEEFNELLQKLTPENRAKVIDKYYELLKEQEAEERH